MSENITDDHEISLFTLPVMHTSQNNLVADKGSVKISDMASLKLSTLDEPSDLTFSTPKCVKFQNGDKMDPNLQFFQKYEQNNSKTPKGGFFKCIPHQDSADILMKLNKAKSCSDKCPDGCMVSGSGSFSSISDVEIIDRSAIQLMPIVDSELI